MKTLTTLIRLRKQRIDELRRSINALEEKKDELRKASERLEEQLQQEIEMASEQAEMSGFFGNFAERIRMRQREFADGIAQLDKHIDKITAEVRLEFGELKKFEIMRERKISEAKEKERKREDAELDEIAGQQHLRKTKEEH